MKKYDVVFSDPPWQYYGSETKWGAAEKFYRTSDESSLENIARPPLNKPGVLFMWSTSSKLEESISLINKWDLHYRGVAFVWVKTTLAGTPIRAQGVRPSIVKPLTEFVLCASNVRQGRPLKLHSESVVQTVFSPKREHSRKPNEPYQRIEEMYPDSSKLEMFSRTFRTGWDSHGDELGTFKEEVTNEPTSRDQ